MLSRITIPQRNILDSGLRDRQPELSLLLNNKQEVYEGLATVRTRKLQDFSIQCKDSYMSSGRDTLYCVVQLGTIYSEISFWQQDHLILHNPK